MSMFACCLAHKCILTCIHIYIHVYRDCIHTYIHTCIQRLIHSHHGTLTTYTPTYIHTYIHTYIQANEEYAALLESVRPAPQFYFSRQKILPKFPARLFFSRQNLFGPQQTSIAAKKKRFWHFSQIKHYTIRVCMYACMHVCMYVCMLVLAPLWQSFPN